MDILNNRFTRKFLDWWSHLSPPKLLVYLGLLAVLVGSWIFIAIAEEMLEGDTERLDNWVLQSLRVPGHPREPIGPPWLDEFFVDVTALGSGSVAVLIASLVVVGLALQKRYLPIAILVISVAGGGILTTVLKGYFGRPRPPLEFRAIEAGNLSFPSGHAFTSAVLYLTLGAMLARVAQTRSMKTYVLTVSGILTLLVGFSRVYLGVHYATDVVAGWCAGAIWAIACLLAAELLRTRSHARRSDLSNIEQ